MKRFRIKRNQLKGVPTSLKHAGGSHLQALGSHSMYVIHNDKLVETEIYFSSGVQNIYLFLDLCKSLSLIHEQFPHVNIDHVQANSISDSNTSHTIPTRPTELPYPDTENNIQKLEFWLLNALEQTVFNTINPLPKMTGKPHKIHLEDDAVFYVAYTPIPIPYHWNEEVKKQLEEDVRLGIIQKAPVGQASDWCMQMVTVAKKDRSPCRTIDFTTEQTLQKRSSLHTITYRTCQKHTTKII